MNILFFDVQTIGFPDLKSNVNNSGLYTQLDKFDSARMIKISWSVYSKKGEKLSNKNFIVKPDNFEIVNTNIHGVTAEKASNDGVHLSKVADELEKELYTVNMLVAHNIKFHFNVLCSELYRYDYHQIIKRLQKMQQICTGEQTKDLLKIPLKSTYFIERYKMPKLEELFEHCFKEKIENNHDSQSNVEYISKIFFYLIK